MQVVSSESSPISESDITAAQQFGHSTTVPEWLGSIAPVAAVLPHNAVGSRVGNGFVTAAVFFDRRISDSSGWWPQVSSVLHFGTYVFRLGAAALAMASIRRHRFDRR